MKITELAKHLESLGSEAPESVYGVEVDAYTPNVCRQVKEIGILAKPAEDDPSSLDWDALDCVLSYSGLNNVSTIIEVPFGSSLDAEKIIVVAMNCDVAISVLPPAGESDEDWATYKDTLIEYTKIWLSQKNARKPLLPASGYFQYLIQREFDYQQETLATDPYVKFRFVDEYSVERLDALKSELEPVIHAHFGGPEGFTTFAHSLAIAVGKRADTLAKDMISSAEA